MPTPKSRFSADLETMIHPYPMEVSTDDFKQKRFPQVDQAALRDLVKATLAEKIGILPEEILLGKSTTATSELVFSYLWKTWEVGASPISKNRAQTPKALLPAPTYNGIVTQLHTIGWDVLQQEYPIPGLYTDEYRESFLRTIKDQQPHIVVIANPNNPTGAFFDPRHIAEFCDELAQYGGYLVVDEAYLSAVDPNRALSSVSLLRPATPTNSTTSSVSNHAHTNLIILESVHKNWPIHDSQQEACVELSTEGYTAQADDAHKMALVYSSASTIEALKNEIEVIKDKASQSNGQPEQSAQALLESLTPTLKAISILDLVLLDPDYWQNAAHALVSQITRMLNSLYSVNELLEKRMSEEASDGKTQEPVLLIPDKSINGVMVVGVLRSALEKAMGETTVVESLSEKGVTVVPVFTDHSLSDVYEFFRIVVRDEVQNSIFLQAFFAILTLTLDQPE